MYRAIGRIGLACALWLNACMASAQPRDNPLAFLSLPAMQQTRQALNTGEANAHSLQAWQQLQRQADRALTQPDPSVMDKGIMPPGGSRHDYLSLSAYWWPDPQQANGLPWIQRDGQVNPASKNNQSDGARFARFSADVQALTLAWYFSGDVRYASKAQSMLRHWFIDPATRMNPNLNYAQGVPGRSDGRHDGVLDGRYFATRLVDALLLLRDAPGWTLQDQQAMQHWFCDYLHWLQTSPLALKERGAPNNHGSWYSAQLAGIAWYLQRPAVMAEMATLAQNKIDGQIHADGSQPFELARTRSFHYSVFNLQALTATAQLAQRSGAGDIWHYRNAQGGSLLAALNYMAPYSDPMKPWPWKNRDRVSLRLIPLLSLADNSLNTRRYQPFIQQADWSLAENKALTPQARAERGAAADAEREVWLFSLPGLNK